MPKRKNPAIAGTHLQNKNNIAGKGRRYNNRRLGKQRHKYYFDKEYQMNALLKVLPAGSIAKYPQKPPKNSVAFLGYPQQHPSDKSKLLLVHDPLGLQPRLLEFKLDDVLYVEETHSAVTEKGEGVPLVKLWIRKRAHGMILEPFVVNEEKIKGKR